MTVQPKEAVAIANAYVAGLFADEHPTDIGLEELDFDERGRPLARDHRAAIR